MSILLEIFQIFFNHKYNHDPSYDHVDTGIIWIQDKKWFGTQMVLAAILFYH